MATKDSEVSPVHPQTQEEIGGFPLLALLLEVSGTGPVMWVLSDEQLMVLIGYPTL